MKKLSLPQLLVLNAYWVGLSFMWNALHPIILPAILLNYVPYAQKNTYLGLMTFVGLIIAMVVQPISGALSDGWVSKWGRRRPLMVAGTLFDFVFLVILGWAGGLFWLFVGYIGLQFSSNIAHGPAQGLLPDVVPEEQLGVASAWKTFMDMFSLIIASLAAGRLLDPVTRDPTLIILVVIGALAIFGAITVLGTPEKSTVSPQNSQRKNNLSGLRALRGELFHIDFHSNTSYWWLISERLLFLIGIYGVQAFDGCVDHHADHHDAGGGLAFGQIRHETHPENCQLPDRVGDVIDVAGAGHAQCDDLRQFPGRRHWSLSDG